MNRSARANAHTNTQRKRERDNLLNQIGMETTMPIRKENRSKSTATAAKTTTTKKKLKKIQLQHRISIMQSNVCLAEYK